MSIPAASDDQAAAIGRKLLSRIEGMDPLARARLCARALGKGWMDLVFPTAQERSRDDDSYGGDG